MFHSIGNYLIVSGILIPFKRQYSLPSRKPYAQCILRTDSNTITTTDTFHTIRRFRRVDTHAANFSAFATRHTFTAIKFGMIECKLIEKAINCTKRTHILAERSPNNDAQQNNRQKYGELPCEHYSQKRADSFIPKGKQDSGNSAGRTDVLAEKRSEGIKHGQHNHQNQDRILQETQ